MRIVSAVGYVLRSESARVVYAFGKRPLPIGEYVVAEHETEEGRITSIGVISNAGYLHAVPKSTLEYMDDRVGESYTAYSPLTIYVVAEITKRGARAPPRYPIPPDTPISKAEIEHLKALYRSEEGLRIGVLMMSGQMSGEMEIKVDPNALGNHLLIAGATGSGKSNTVAILADRLSAMGAPVIIFDVHGEYNMETEDGDRRRLEVYKPEINLFQMPIASILSMMTEERASVQRMVLKEAIADTNKWWEERVKNREVDPKSSDAINEYAKKLKERISTEEKNKHIDKKEATRILMRIDDFFETYKVSVDPRALSPLDYLVPGRIVVVDVSSFIDDEKRWYLYYLAGELLRKLKSGELRSAVLVVEEAPLFIGSDVLHPVRGTLQRFAREGRKFGGILVVVSQRPRSLDVNVTSQLQNFIFLRMVQEEDIRTVMNISDNLDSGLASIIPTLPDGGAIVMGRFVGKFPVLVKIDAHKGKRLGATPSFTKMWDEELRRLKQGEGNYDV